MFDTGTCPRSLRNDARRKPQSGWPPPVTRPAGPADCRHNTPARSDLLGSLDYFQWTAILRAVSSLTAYHWVYRESVKPWLVADLLILKKEMPRSLIACYDNIVHLLDAIGDAYGRAAASQRQAHEVMARLADATPQEI